MTVKWTLKIKQRISRKINQQILLKFAKADLNKNSDELTSNLKIESLILAQDERWRRA